MLISKTTPKPPQELAKAWREQTNRQKGVVIVFKNKVAGWMDNLRNPDHWEPGCIAVDGAGNQFLAVGGDPCNGAKQWQALA